MCEYCRESEKLEIAGKIIRTFEWKETAGYEAPRNRNDFLEMFILKGKNDKKAGMMIDAPAIDKMKDVKLIIDRNNECGGAYVIRTHW